jgi:hypothetical protein
VKGWDCHQAAKVSKRTEIVLFEPFDRGGSSAERPTARGCELPLNEVYDNVTFGPEHEPTEIER